MNQAAPRRTSLLDMLAVSLVAILAGLTVLVVLWGGQVGIRAGAQIPSRGIGPYGPLTIVFSEPVDASRVEAVFSVQPEAKGTITWQNAQTLQFIPFAPFQLDVDYTVRISPGLLATSGKYLKRAYAHIFHVREPLIAYLVSQNGTTDLWVVDAQGESARRLTDGRHAILTFDTARSGEFLVFSAFNEQGGMDLWRIERSGGPAELLLDCGKDRCTVPALAPDEEQVAYAREAFIGDISLPYGSPRIWLLNLSTRQDSPICEDSQILGYGPSWSPDGRWLVSYDGLVSELRLLDLTSGIQLILTTETGSPYAWSPDGQLFLYTDLELQDTVLVTRVRQAKLEWKESFTMFGENDKRDFAYSSLAWSPTGEHVILGMRAEEQNPAHMFWLFDPSSLQGPMIVNESGYSYSDPYWDPWGSSIIFRQFKLKETYKPEIGIWSFADQNVRFLVNGEMARWLP